MCPDLFYVPYINLQKSRKPKKICHPDRVRRRRASGGTLCYYFFFLGAAFLTAAFLATAFLAGVLLSAAGASAFSFLGFGSFLAISGAVNFCPSNAISVIRTAV